jgi:glycosyltransferase involved in cell wall biosynthesis
VKRWRDELDALLIRGPSPLLPAIAGAVDGLPISLLLVGDYLAGIDDINKPRWIKEIVRLWARWNHYQQMKVARRSLTFVNSRKLYNELRPYVEHLVETRTTTLTSADFYEREDTCTQRPVHLLYTGRMAHAKGLLQMVEALALLVNSGEDVVLDLVGWPGKGDPILDEVQALAREKGVVNRVFYHGYKSVGPELFAYYKQADIYVIASTSDFEGFPRTIWEAMAHSLPVVATQVGSIPQFLEHQVNAWLVEPRSAANLAEGVMRVIQQGELRRYLIAQAGNLALENTLEKRADEMCTHIKNWV